MKDKKIIDIINEYPFVVDFFESNRLSIKGYENFTIDEFKNSYKIDEKEDEAIDLSDLDKDIVIYIEQMKEFLGLKKEDDKVNILTILPGFNKDNEKENFERLDIYPSDIIAIVGATGSGKSRLLADIEWAANEDTPTKRKILINGSPLDSSVRYATNKKLVAQLSQNMNFVMDLSVGEFIRLHASSRMVENIDEICSEILKQANYLAGESFKESTAVTSLSGGQSRALMIADTAILSKSPIVLIDEIENAGIDRNKALELLVSSDKIVLIATHDPLLALNANKRIIIKNGGIANVLKTSYEEKALLKKFEKLDRIIGKARAELRLGEELKADHFIF